MCMEVEYERWIFLDLFIFVSSSENFASLFYKEEKEDIFQGPAADLFMKVNYFLTESIIKF